MHGWGGTVGWATTARAWVLGCLCWEWAGRCLTVSTSQPTQLPTDSTHPSATSPICTAGLGLPLPLEPPYTDMRFLATGGSSEDRADDYTPASTFAQIIDVRRRAGGRVGGVQAAAGWAARSGQDFNSSHVITLSASEAVPICILQALQGPCMSPTHLLSTHPPLWAQLTAGPEATWRPAGPMPGPRVMGDAGGCGVVWCGWVGGWGGMGWFWFWLRMGWGCNQNTPPPPNPPTFHTTLMQSSSVTAP